MRHLKFGGLLALFWLLLSGHTGVLLLSLGLASVILVLWLIGRMDHHDESPSVMVLSIGFLRYVAWLTWQVIIANIDVARRIWDPDMPIKPAWRKIPVRLQHPLFKAIYANSITLTPGTVTTEVGEDYFVVHALNGDGVDDLEAGAMESRLLELEEKH